MKTITELKAESTLNKVFRYDEGIMTRKEWINLKVSAGWMPIESTKTQNQFNRIKFNRMNGREQAEYERKCNEIITCFNLKQGTQFYEITKAEFDFANSLLLTHEDILDIEEHEIHDEINEERRNGGIE